MARTHFYFGLIRKSIIKFLSIFDDMKVAKYDSDGNVIKYVEVPLKFMPKKKWYSWIYERSHEKRFPVIGAEITSISYDSARESGRYEKSTIDSGDNTITYTRTPVPYNITFQLSVATEYLSEQDQIAEQILPFFNPYVYTSVYIEDIDTSIDVKIGFESVSPQQDVDIVEDEYRTVLWQYEFTANVYLLRPESSIKTIRKVVQKIYTSDQSWESRDTSTDMPSGQGGEQVELLTIGSRDEDANIIISYERFGD